jgi:endonuclease III
VSTVLFDEDRAYRVLSDIALAYRTQRQLYSRVHARECSAPQHKHIPPGVHKASPEHQIFLFLTTLITYASETDAGFRQSVRLYAQWPEYFGPELCKVSQSTLAHSLRRVGFVRPMQGAEYWHTSGSTLFREYGASPLEILRVESVDAFIAKKRSMRKKLGYGALAGIGPKIFSLMALFFEELGLLDEVPGAFPVDLHVQRICISTGIVQSTGRVHATYLAEFLRPRLYALCNKLGIRPFDLAHALWFLGNRVCTRCRDVEGLASVCPAMTQCDGAIPSHLYGNKGLWDFSLPRHQKGSMQYSLFENDPTSMLDLAEHGRNRP